MEKNKHRNCPICDHAYSNTLKEIQLEVIDDFILPTEYSIVACLNCGHVFNDVEYNDNYVEYYSNYQDISNFSVPTRENSDLSEVKLESRYLGTANFIENFCDLDQEAQILDVGCSYGGVLLHLKEKKFQNLHGLDLDSKSLDNLRKANISTTIGSIFDENIEALNTKFDLIILGHILEHLHNPQKALQNVEKWLKPNGKILIEVPDLIQYPETSPFPSFYAEHEHINHFGLISLMNLMRGYKLTASYANHIFALIPNFPCLHAVFEKGDMTNQLIYSSNDEIAMRNCLSEPNQYGKIVLNNVKKLDNRQIILWGAGMYAYRLLTHTELKNKNIVAIVDMSEEKLGKKIINHEITKVESISQYPNAVIVICSTTKCDDILRTIEINQFTNDVIIPFIEGGNYD